MANIKVGGIYRDTHTEDTLLITNIVDDLAYHTNTKTNESGRTPVVFLANCCDAVVTTYDVFQDRAESLLERWRTFRTKHPDMKNIDSICIKGFLSEINDGLIK